MKKLLSAGLIVMAASGTAALAVEAPAPAPTSESFTVVAPVVGIAIATSLASFFAFFLFDGTGTNFNRWKDKLIFFLTALKVSYVFKLDLPAIPPPTNDDSEELRKQRAKREEDEVLCRDHILNTLSDMLYDLFMVAKNPREI
ncbi:hypothetical protein ZIOFF_053506 [Zingiber officinale]|uniref:Uncharacterized protein n=1 Tax=Zingiber officinale TaxID=94328 RepID=A0A8J5FCK6_ZINOF|nr:hypothetical protein ZIOFF_053506 [Zingiber officinale]